MLAENTFLEWVVGSDPDASGTPKIQWAYLPESWGVFVLIAIIAAVIFGVFWMYRREINTCPMPIKFLMAGLRLAVLLLLIAMFLKPSVYYQQVNEIKPTIAWLRDSSLSFDRGDNYRSKDQANKLASSTGLSADEIAAGQIKRSQLLNQAFKKNPKLLEQLRDKGSIRVINFSDGNSPVAVIPANVKNDSEKDKEDDEDEDNPDSDEEPDEKTEDPDSDAANSIISESMPDLEATGLGTDIWQALRASLDDASRLSSIVLISDGQHNGTEDPTEIARKAASLGIPIFVIGVGDPNPPKNLAVNEVYVREKAYPDEPFEIEAILQTSQVGDEGMPSSINVELVQQQIDATSGKPGAPQPVKTKPVDVPPNGGRIRVDFDHILNQPGKYIYTVQVAALENETETDDNAMVSSQIEVVDEKVRVLLVSGLPSWDYQQVQRLLQRDSTISLSCWLQSMDETRPQEGNESISRLPRTRQELAEYNVVILMDPNAEEFDAEWMDNLKEFCKTKAGGVLFMAGPQFTTEFITMNRLKSLRDLLPVRFGDIDFIDTIEVLTSAKGGGKAGKMLLVNHNMDHPVMSFRADPAETQKIWNLMPGIYWSFPTMAPKPTARVLLERGDQASAEGNQPLMVAGRYGAGSVLYIGFQGTWRWRPLGVQAQYFDRFWIQVVRYLVETRSLQGSRRGFIDAEKTEFELGDRIVLVGRVLDQEFRPSTQEIHQAKIRSDDGRTQTVELKLLPNQEGRYEGTFVAQRIGNYQATIDLGTEGEEKLIDPIAFRVVPPTAESGAYWLNEKLLSEIATQSGGKYFHLDELDQVATSLPTLVTRAEFNSPPEPIWDGNRILRWLMFGLPVVLLTIEWILRKWYKLL